MARLITSGFELGSVATEFGLGYYSGSPSVQSTTKRSGVYALSIPAGANLARFYLGTPSNVTYFARAYLFIASLPSSEEPVFGFFTTSEANGIYLALDSGGRLVLKDNSSSPANVGSWSSALSLNTWHRCEISYNPSTKGIAFCLNGPQVSSGTAAAALATPNSLVMGASAVTLTGSYYFDDVALNDDSGADQNSWPGEGKVIHLKPNAAGDSNTWSPATTANYQRVDEVPPNDATDYVYATANGKSDFYGCEDSGLSAAVTISLVAIGLRHSLANIPAATYKLQVKKTSGGTIVQSATIGGSSTWSTNNVANAIPRQDGLILYQDPDGATWTPTTLDSMQIGYAIVAAGTYQRRVSAVWAAVEYRAGMTRELSASGSMTSATPDIAFTIARALSAAIPGTSVTGTPTATAARELSASGSLTTLTPVISAVMDGLIHFTASVSMVSATPDISVTTSRRLTAFPLGESITGEAASMLRRRLAASGTCQSSTPDTVRLILDLMTHIRTPGFRSITARRAFLFTTPARAAASLTPRRAIEPTGGLD